MPDTTLSILHEDLRKMREEISDLRTMMIRHDENLKNMQHDLDKLSRQQEDAKKLAEKVQTLDKRLDSLQIDGGKNTLLNLPPPLVQRVFWGIIILVFLNSSLEKGLISPEALKMLKGFF